MKKLILFFALALISTTIIFSQGICTLRLEVPDPLPNIGEEFLVGLWLDELSNPVPDNYFKSGQIFLEFDETVVDEVPGPPPFFKLYENLSQALVDYGATPAFNNPPDRLAYVTYTTLAPGIQFDLYGGIPHKLWDIRFIYYGGNINIKFGTEPNLDTVVPDIPGGETEKTETIMTVWNSDNLDLLLIGYPSVGGTDIR